MTVLDGTEGSRNVVQVTASGGSKEETQVVDGHTNGNRKRTGSRQSRLPWLT